MGGTTRKTEFIDSPGGCKTGERRCEEMSQAWLCGKLQRSLGSRVILRLSDFQTLSNKLKSPKVQNLDNLSMNSMANSRTVCAPICGKSLLTMAPHQRIAGFERLVLRQRRHMPRR
jgi:hypothetical protein